MKFDIFFQGVSFLVTLLNCCSFANSRCCEILDNECFPRTNPYLFIPEPHCPTGDFEPVFELFTRDNRISPLKFQLICPPWEKLSKRPSYRFFVPGWKGKTSNPRFVKLTKALLEKEDVNVILVNWYKMSKIIWYPTPASNTRTVGAYMALFYKEIEKMQSDYHIWCIGHSLGAHVCGHSGQRKKIHRITGLDPAGPFFQGIPDARIGLSPDDADFVDVIHTTAILGTFKRLGHADFYLNGGRFQPACNFFDFMCPHHIATDYFTQTVQNQCSVNWKCYNIWFFAFTCSRHSGINWGYDASADKHGAYWIAIKSKVPYC